MSFKPFQALYKLLVSVVLLAVLGGAGYIAYRVYKGGTNGFGFHLVKDSYGRGVGKPLICGADEEQDGALCYPKCKDGYKGVGPVCWQQCPASFRDDGAFCGKPEPYGRGVGYPLWDEKKCEKEHGACEKDGLLWYPKCKSGFHNVGCCVCSPDCQSGMQDIGVSCQKKSYGRTVGKPLHACPEDQDKDGALCYPKCKSGYRGAGPLCTEI